MNLIGRFRSNYFAVKDRATFEQWCQKRGLKLIENKEHPDLVGFVNHGNESGIPWTTIEENSDSNEEKQDDIDFIGELAALLEDQYVAIVIEIVYEGYRYLDGVAYATNNKGQQRKLVLADITALAQVLGEYITKCEY